MKVRMMNFSHDLALARDCDRYTPPPNVSIMEHDLAPLARYLPDGNMSYHARAPIWGWDRAVVTRLRQMGCVGLPTPSQLDEIRSLSSRKTAVSVLKTLLEQCPDLPLTGQSVFCTTEAEMDHALLPDSPMILKEPLSGSGRGLRFVNNVLSLAQRNWALRCMRQQGGVVVEPLYDKVRDFALEFTATHARVEFAGLSLFQTNSNNVYAGNRIAPQQVLWNDMYTYFAPSLFQRLTTVLSATLHDVFAGRYLGPLGVDMMIVRHQGELCIHPCVEINVRRTMGELSLHQASLLSPHTTGFFFLIYDKTPAVLADKLACLPRAAYDTDGRLAQGTMILAKGTHYAAVLSVE